MDLARSANVLHNQTYQARGDLEKCKCFCRLPLPPAAIHHSSGIGAVNQDRRCIRTGLSLPVLNEPRQITQLAHTRRCHKADSYVNSHYVGGRAGQDCLNTFLQVLTKQHCATVSSCCLKMEAVAFRHDAVTGDAQRSQKLASPIKCHDELPFGSYGAYHAELRLILHAGRKALSLQLTD